ncbi:MAG: arginine--tRNA ligase, partial [Theionarchaea archaeon]|nr:arginine--tRNA ligase [Theionarchaea archaeon]
IESLTMAHMKDLIEQEVRKKAAALYGYEGDIEIKSIPFKGEWGFSTTLAYKIAGKLGGDFKECLSEVSEALAAELDFGEIVDRIESVNGYINIYLNTNRYSRTLISSIVEGEFGRGEKKADRIMVEYSQPNTHKAFHIGHLRGTCLGAALVNILRYAGYEVVAANLINDTGSHVARWLWCYLTYHRGEEPPQRKSKWLEDIYVEASRRLREDPSGEREVKNILQLLEQRDREIVDLWEKSKQWSLEEFYRIYDELGVQFDVYFFDSQLYEEGKHIVGELLEKRIAEESSGAIIVDLDRHLGTHDVYKTYVALRSDGTALYQTKDLALARRKFTDYNIDRSIYVVGSEQKLHFNQVFKTLELYGFNQAKKCYHLSYELVMLKGGKMSSRMGNIIFYDDLYEDVFSEALQEVEKREIVQENKEHTARIVSLGALKFSMLKKDNNKTILFDPKEAVNFEGQTGAYIQYAHARASRILEKEAATIKEIIFEELTKEEKNLLELLAAFPDMIHQAAENYKPSILANHIFDCAKAFNEFYHACPVLQADPPLKKARLALVLATRKILRTGLNIMGIEAPERM